MSNPSFDYPRGRILLRLGPEHPHDRRGDAAPLPLFVDELLAPLAGQRVEARLAVVLGGAPRGVDEAAVLEPLQRRVERAVVDDQDVVGLALDRAGDALAVLRAEDQGPQDRADRACPGGGRSGRPSRAFG